MYFKLKDHMLDHKPEGINTFCSGKRCIGNAQPLINYINTESTTILLKKRTNSLSKAR